MRGIHASNLSIYTLICVVALVVYNWFESVQSLHNVQRRQVDAAFFTPPVVEQALTVDASTRIPHTHTEFFLSGARGNRTETSSLIQLLQAHVGVDQHSTKTTITTTTQQQPLCRRHQVVEGQWIPVTLDKPPYVTKTKHLRCYPPEYYKQDTFPSWDWQPADDSCHMTPWNLTSFCDLTAYSTVSIIGDSLSWEHYSSLLQLSGQRIHQSDQHKSKSQKRNHVQYACRNQQQKHDDNDDHDDHNRKSTTTAQTRVVFRNDPRLEHLTDSIQHDFPVVLILNRGAHYVNDTMLLTGIRDNVVELQAWRSKCRRLTVACHLFWRTSVPGHVGCTTTTNNSSQPFVSLEVAETDLHNRSLYTDEQWNYHWYDYQRQNQLILQELEASGLDFTVIDAYELNMLRPDEHRAHQGDCLHNCYPGKQDVYSQLLLHYLSMQRSETDVQHMHALQEAAREHFRNLDNTAAEPER